MNYNSDTSFFFDYKNGNKIRIQKYSLIDDSFTTTIQAKVSQWAVENSLVYYYIKSNLDFGKKWSYSQFGTPQKYRESHIIICIKYYV